MAEDMDALIEKVDTLIKLVSIGLVEGKTQREQIWLLSKAGLQPSQIAEFIGTSINTVRVELSVMRKAYKKRPRKRVQQEKRK